MTQAVEPSDTGRTAAELAADPQQTGNRYGIRNRNRQVFDRTDQLAPSEGQIAPESAFLDAVENSVRLHGKEPYRGI